MEKQPLTINNMETEYGQKLFEFSKSKQVLPFPAKKSTASKNFWRDSGMKFIELRVRAKLRMTDSGNADFSPPWSRRR